MNPGVPASAALEATPGEFKECTLCHFGAAISPSGFCHRCLTAPAFPVNYRDRDKNGLTKREYFAALAMQSVINTNPGADYESCAKDAVQCADALLAKLAETEVGL